jgi:phosphatidylglycerophosphate synthase
MRSHGPPSAAPADLRAQWSALHGEYDAESSVALRSWLATVHAIARPLAQRGVSPNSVTCAAGLFAAGSVFVARRAPACAAIAVLGSVVLDGVDGAVAIASGRVTDRGAALDSMGDRIADACFGLALWRLGAPRRLSLLAAVSPLAFEQVRARVTDNRRRGVGPITLGDRPARVGIVLTALLLAGRHRRRAKLIATTGAVAVVGACAGGADRLRRAASTAA